MSVFEYMAGKYYPDSKKVNSQIDGQDVSSSLYEELRNIKDWLDRVKALHNQADNMDENDSDTAKDPSMTLQATGQIPKGMKVTVMSQGH